MQIAILSQYYSPVNNACSNRVTSLANGLKSLGHNITVITGMPNYPDGVKHRQYRRRLFMRESVDGIPVLRTYEYATSNAGIVGRALNYASFMLSSIAAVTLIPRQDILIVSTPPLFITVSARFIASFKADVLVCDVRDVWPQSLFELGYAKKSGILARLLSRMERRVYQRSDCIVAATNGIREYLQNYIQNKLTEETPVVVSPNGVPKDIVVERSKFNRKSEHPFLLYVGNHSHAQDLMQFLEYARKLKSEPSLILSSISFLFVGDGDARNDLLKYASDHSISNVEFAPWMPRNQIYDLIQKCDGCIVSLAEIPLFDGAIPSKTYEYMYFGKPIFTNGLGELEKMLKNASCAYFFKSNDYLSFKDALLEAFTDWGCLEQKGILGKQYVSKHHMRDRIISTLESTLTSLIS